MREFLFGSAYYPEHWDEATRAGDPALFRAAGWNVIRMGEFAWDRIEPEAGRFDLALFDATIADFGSKGIRTIFCTPTATPPRWLSVRHPEILRVDAKGVPLAHGSRQHASHFSPVFRAHSRRITAELARHFAGNPHVIGWQTDNEFHCHFADDHSPAAQAAFTEFLRERFADDIAALNRAWGTAFWGQTYARFEDVPTPRPLAPTYLNPAHALDYRRFLDWGVTGFQREQVDILRAANPRWWVTHNDCYQAIDYRGPFTRDLDFLGFDGYPFFEFDPARRAAFYASYLDGIRAFSGNFVVMEHQSGPGGQGEYFHDNPEPGELRRIAWTAVAHGADGLLLFRERSCRFGAEEYWCGVLDHDNVPRRRYHEAARLGAEFARVGKELLGTSVRVDVGIAGADYTAEQGHVPMTLGLPAPREIAEQVHGVFHRRGQAVGIVHPADELSGLRLYLIPHLALFDPAWLPNLQAFVDGGGWLVVGARTASKDLNNNVVPETLPGVLRPLVGASVEEYGRQNRPERRPLRMRVGDTELATELWYELLQPDAGTEVVATWTTRHLAGGAAVTLRRHGRDGVMYVGTYLTSVVTEALLPVLGGLGAVPTPLSSWPGIEVTERMGAGRTFRVVINHHDEPAQLPWPADAGEELLGHEVMGGELHLAPHDVALFRMQ